MSDFSKESVPSIGTSASAADPRNADGETPSRRLQAWRWGTRSFLALVFLMAVSELFVFRGAFFRMVTPPPPKPNLKALGKESKEGEQPQQLEFDPTNLETVPIYGPITPLDISDQRQLATKLQELADKVQALEEREGKIRQRALHLGQQDIRDAIWRKVVRGSLKEKETPRLWCDGAGGEDWSLFFGYGIVMPLEIVQGRILCGTASNFDASYLALLENWMRNRSAVLDAWNERLNALSTQLKKEEILTP